MCGVYSQNNVSVFAEILDSREHPEDETAREYYVHYDGRKYLFVNFLQSSVKSVKCPALHLSPITNYNPYQVCGVELSFPFPLGVSKCRACGGSNNPETSTRMQFVLHC